MTPHQWIEETNRDGTKFSRCTRCRASTSLTPIQIDSNGERLRSIQGTWFTAVYSDCDLEVVELVFIR